MELDAIARFLQDIGNDDTDDAGMEELGLAWVARRAVIDITSHAKAREKLTLQTWCSGTGRQWAERRTSIRGEHGAHMEASAIWVHLDTITGRPTAWGENFATTYLEATAGRLVDAKLRHRKDPPSTSGVPWRFRQSDMDAFGHVNNAAYLAIAEEFFGLDGQQGDSVRVEVEWRGPSEAGEQLSVVHDDQEQQLWVIGPSTEESVIDLRVTIKKL